MRVALGVSYRGTAYQGWQSQPGGRTVQDQLELALTQFLDTPVSQFVSINTLSANDYRIDIDVVSADGAPCDRKALSIASRASNGYTLELASAADNVRVRYRVSKLNN